MKCPKCRNESPDGSEYCPVCYEVLVRKSAGVTRDPVPAAPAPSGGGGGWLSGLVKLAAGAAIGYALIGRLPASGRGRMPSLSLPTRGSSAAVALDRCPTAKCLTVYVAPWCPHCRAAGPLIQAVRDDLAKRGVTTRIVVGMDQAPAVEGYADEFGPDTLLDSGSQFKIPGGVPAVFVSDGRGVLLEQMSGLPEMAPPADAAGLREVEAEAFGVP